MKKQFAFVFIVISATSCRNVNQEIDNTFLKYVNSTLTNNYNDLLNYIPDEYFTITPKEEMLQSMKKHYGDPDPDYELIDAKIIEIRDSELIEGKYYSLFKYSKKWKSKRKRKTDETNADLKTIEDLTKMLFEATYGEKNVSYDSITNFFEINSEEYAFATSSNGQTNWKFIFDNDLRDPWQLELFPKQLRDRIPKRELK